MTASTPGDAADRLAMIGGLDRVLEVDPEGLVQEVRRHVVGDRVALELLLEVLVRLLVVLEVDVLLMKLRQRRLSCSASPIALICAGVALPPPQWALGTSPLQR